jgi:hypothetical protein
VSPELLANEDGLPLLDERHDALDLVGTTERRMKSGAFVAESHLQRLVIACHQTPKHRRHGQPRHRR